MDLLRRLVRSALPNAVIVFDHFHVNALINKALDEVRRQLQQTLENTPKKVIKGKRFLLLKNYSTLDKSAKDGLQALLDVNAPTSHRAYTKRTISYVLVTTYT